MNETSAAMAVLDIGNRADEDNAMENDPDLKRDIGAGFKEVNVRIDELRRETTARIDELRRETTVRIDGLLLQTRADIAALNTKIDAVRHESLAAIADSRKEAFDHFLALQTQMNELRRETTARIDAFSQEINRRMDRGDVQFRWLVGLMVTSLLATAGLFARASHLL